MKVASVEILASNSAQEQIEELKAEHEKMLHEAMEANLMADAKLKRVIRVLEGKVEIQSKDKESALQEFSIASKAREMEM